MPIDRRISYKIVIDTETAPLMRGVNDVIPENMWSYDIGYAVIDKRGRVYLTRSFVNADIFLYEKDAMTSAYYARKIPEYWEDIKAGKRVLTSFYNIRKTFLDDMRLYNVKQVYAHNMRFDYGTLNTTARWVTKSRVRYFFPYGTEICDTLKMARDVVAQMPTYKRFCEENGYLTRYGKPRLTAEIIYRFIKRQPDFVEEHKGLDDVLIEKEILAYCFRQHKKMRRTLF